MTVEEQISAGPVFGSMGRAEYDRLARELTGYCYRMLGSPFDAEDAVQDTMLRAWRQQDRFEGRSSVRTWLHAIATNVCLDMLRSRSRRSVPMDLEPPSAGDGSGLRAPLEESRWVLPIPDARLWAGGADPAQHAESRETVRLAFVAALQHLTPRQRAVLILRDVLKFSAAESAELLGTSVASANSALQRARGALPADGTDPLPADGGTRARPAGGTGARPAGGADGAAGAALLEEFISAFEAYDIRRLTALLRSDAVQSMPPLQMWLSGAAEIGRFMTGPGAECRGSRVLPSAANGGLAFAQYRSDGRGGHAPWALGLLETDGQQITALHSFLIPELFGLFGFPAALER